MAAGVALALAAAVGGVIFFAVVERILNAFLSTVWYAAVGFSPGETPFNFAAVNLVSQSGSVSARVVTSVLNSVLAMGSGIATWLVGALFVIFVTGALYVMYEQYPLVARGFGIQWNAGMGPRLHGILLVPIEIANVFLGALLPIYNTVVWVANRIIFEGVVMPILGNPDATLKVFTSTALFTKTFAESATVYSIATFRDCNQSVAELGDGFPASSCVGDVGLRTFDFITPMSHVRDAVAVTAAWIGEDFCPAAARPLDAIVAPILDINFAKMVHGYANAVLWVFLQVPIVTESRCRMFRETDGIAMCLPDFVPAGRFLVEALRRTGQLLDNWMDVVFLIVQDTVNPGSVPRCEDEALTTVNVNDDLHRTLFGSNATVVVGLTETMFASTDGHGVVYYSTAKRVVEHEYVEAAWPVLVDVRMGVAAVQYGDDGEEGDDRALGRTTSMMGCRYDLQGWG
jgi:hypothetical protein